MTCRHWFRRALILVSVVCALHPAIGFAVSDVKPVDLGASDVPRIPLWQALQTLPDKTGKLSVSQAAEAFSTGKGALMPHADHAYGKWIPYPYWAKFSLRNSSSAVQTRLFSYELPTQDGIALWQASSSVGGAWQPLAQTDEADLSFGSGELYPVWRITLQPGQTQDFMIRLDGYNLMRFPLFAMRDDAFAKQQRSLFLGLGIVLTVPLVALLYVLTLIRIAEDKSLPIFIVMALAEMIGAGWVSGLLHATLPWIDRWTSGWLGWSAYATLLGLSAVHAQVFMSTKTTDRLAHYVLLALAVVWLVVLPAYALIRPEAARLCLLVGGTVHALTLTWLSVRGYQRLPKLDTKMHMALFISVWVVYAGSGLLYVAYRIAQLPIYVTLMSNFIQGSLVAALLGCAVSVQVIRQRRAMQQSMAYAMDRNNLYAAAHHDLWQPIQSVGLYAAALPTANEAQTAHFLRGIESAVTSVHDFMEGLRQVELEPQFQLVDLHELLVPLVEEYRHIASAKQISLHYQPCKMLITSDPALLQRIVRNLLSNAIRYTNKSGRVLIGTKCHQGIRWLMVYDNGIGMSKDSAARCFEAYAREGDLAKVPEGMGLGLYSVKHIAEQLGVSTRLASRLGAGTAIGVSLR